MQTFVLDHGILYYLLVLCWCCRRENRTAGGRWKKRAPSKVIRDSFINWNDWSIDRPVGFWNIVPVETQLQVRSEVTLSCWCHFVLVMMPQHLMLVLCFVLCILGSIFIIVRDLWLVGSLWFGVSVVVAAGCATYRTLPYVVWHDATSFHKYFSMDLNATYN